METHTKSETQHKFPSSVLGSICDTHHHIAVQNGNQLVSEKKKKKFVPLMFNTEPFLSHSPSPQKVPEHLLFTVKSEPPGK